MSTRKIALTLATLLTASVVAGETVPETGPLNAAVRAARADAEVAARELEPALSSLVPDAPGWTCAPLQIPDGAGPSPDAAIPLVQRTCSHTTQTLVLTLGVDVATAAVTCQHIAGTAQGIKDGRIKPALFHFFDTTHWHILRTGVDLEGCMSSGLFLLAQGQNTEAAIASGPAAIDAFANAFALRDPAPVEAAMQVSTAAVARLTAGLDAQSHRMADLIPTPPGAVRHVVVPASPGLPLPTTMVLAFAPSAHVRLTVGECALIVEMSAGPQALYEARTTGQRWGRPGGTDGAVASAYRRRNTPRFVGQERVDGTGIEAVVDGHLILRVVLPGARPCTADPQLVTRIFEAILSADLSDFAAP